MNILFIGDIIGKPGRRIIRELLYSVINKYQVDFCIANTENAASGFGVTQKVVQQLLDMGIDCLTSGNQIALIKCCFNCICLVFSVISIIPGP